MAQTDVIQESHVKTTLRTLVQNRLPRRFSVLTCLVELQSFATLLFLRHPATARDFCSRNISQERLCAKNNEAKEFGIHVRLVQEMRQN